MQIIENKSRKVAMAVSLLIVLLLASFAVSSQNSENRSAVATNNVSGDKAKDDVLSSPFPIKTIATKVGQALNSISSLQMHADLTSEYVQTSQLAEGQVREVLDPRVAVATLPGAIKVHLVADIKMGTTSFLAKMRKASTDPDKAELLLEKTDDGQCTESHWYNIPEHVGYVPKTYPSPNPHGFGENPLKIKSTITEEIPVGVCGIYQFVHTWLGNSYQAQAFVRNIGECSTVELEMLDGKEVYHLSSNDPGDEVHSQGGERRAWWIRNNHFWVDTTTFLPVKWAVPRTDDVRSPEKPHRPWVTYLYDVYAYLYIEIKTKEVITRAD